MKTIKPSLIVITLLTAICRAAAASSSSTSTISIRRARASSSSAAVAEQTSTSSTQLKQPPQKWLAVANQLAPCTTILCSLAPLPTILEVSRSKSVGKMPLLPYTSMICNGFVWALYGHLAQLPTVKYGNMIGITLGSYYFKEWTGAAAASASGAILYHKLVITWAILLNSLVAVRFPRKVSTEIVGKEGVFVFILLFASPLSALKDVIASKSAAAIPLPFTIAALINCSLWSLVGVLLMNDFNIYFPSILGLLCAMVQLLLKGIYGDGVGVGAMKRQSNIEMASHVA